MQKTKIKKSGKELRTGCSLGTNRLSFFILSIILFFIYFAESAEITVGAGAVTGSHLPIEPYYAYSYSQCIYLQSEIDAGGAVNIDTIYYYYNGNSAWADTIAIFMGNTSKSTFSSTTDWIPLGSMTQVYSGTFSVAATPGWYMIKLNNPFLYNNTDNLVIAVDENGSSYHLDTDEFYCTSVGSNRSIYYYNDATNPSPSSPPTGSLSANCANIKLKVFAPVPPENYGDWLYSNNFYLNTTPTGANVPANVLKFPVLIRLNSVNFGAGFGQALSTGYDIRFSKSDGTHLYYERERYDNAGQRAEFWVLVDTVYGNNNSQFIKMYWGKAGTGDSSKSVQVFKSAGGYNFTGVWHLDNFMDATPNSNHGTNYGSIDTMGIIGKAKSFDCVDDSIKIIQSPSINDLDVLTMETWICPKTWGESNYGRIVDKAGLSNGPAFYITNAGGANGVQALAFQRYRATTTTNVRSSDYSLQLNRWSHVVATMNSTTTTKLYINGVETNYLVQTAGSGSLISDVSANLIIGNKGDGTRTFHGYIDDVRISNTVRDPNWIKLCYQNERAKNTLLNGADISPPNNDMTLTAMAIGSDKVKLSWNPSAIDSSDAYQVGIWFKAGDFPDSAYDPSAILAGLYPLTDTLDTIYGLAQNTTIYFSLLVSDEDGNWSDTATSANKTATTSMIGVKTWNGSMNNTWSTASNWTPAIVPGPTDSVVFDSTANACNLNSGVTVKAITFTSGYTGIFNFNTYKLTVNGNADFSIAPTGDIMFSGMSSALELNCNAPQTLRPPDGDTLPGIMKMGSGIINVSGSPLFCDSLTVTGGTFNAGASGIHVLKGLKLFNTGTFTGSGSKVYVDGNVEIMSNTATFNAPSDTLSLGKGFNNSAGGAFNKSGGVVLFRSTLGGNMIYPGGVNMGNMLFKSTSGTWSLNGNLNADTVTIAQGTLNCGSFLIHSIGNLKSITPGGMLNFSSCSLNVNYNADLSKLNSITAGKLCFAGSGTQNFKPRSIITFPYIEHKGSGSIMLMDSALNVDTLIVSSGTFNSNNISLHVFKDLRLKNTGIFSGAGSKVDVDSSIYIYDASVFNAPSDTLFIGRGLYNAGCTFNSPSGGVVMFNSIMGGNNVFPGTGTLRHFIFNGSGGSWTIGGSDIYADTLTIKNGSLSFSPAYMYSIGCLYSIGGAGSLSFSSCTLQVSKDVDLSGLSTITSTGGKLKFVGGMPQYFTPHSTFTLKKVDQAGSGGTSVGMWDLNVDTLTVASGTFNMNGRKLYCYQDLYLKNTGTFTGGSNKIYVYGNVDIQSSGATLNVTSDTMYIGKSLYNSIGGSFNKTSGGLLIFNATTTGNSLYPGSANMGYVLFKGTGGGWTLNGGLNADTLKLADGSLNCGSGIHTVGNLLSITPGGFLDFSSCSLNVANSADFSQLGGITASTGKINFNGTGTQILTPRYNDTLPSVFHKSAGTLQLATYNLACNSFYQNIGILNFNSKNIKTVVGGSFTVTNGTAATFQNLGGDTIAVAGNASFAGQGGNLLNMNPGSAWRLNVTGPTLLADYANIGSCDASGGPWGKATNSTDASGNTRWDFGAPTSAITTPVDSSYVNSLVNIAGTSADGAGSGIYNVKITIMRQSDSKYWDEVSTWVVPETLLTVSGTTGWTYSSVPAWTTGSYTIRSIATDSVGFVQASPDTCFFTFDNTTPSSSISSPTNNSYLKTLANITGTAVDTVSGVNQVQIAIQIQGGNYYNGADWTSPTIAWLNATGTTSWTYAAPSWTNGIVYNIIARAKDNANNWQDAPDTNAFTYDATAPASTITAPANGTYLNSLATISGTASDALSGVSQVQVSIKSTTDNLYWDSDSWEDTQTWLTATGTGAWTYASPAWTNGKTYLIQSKAIDNASNNETPGAGNTFTYDATPPSSSISSPASNSILNSLATISGGANDAAPGMLTQVQVSIRISGGNWWNSSDWTSPTEVWLNATGTTSWTYISPSWTSGTVYVIRSKALDSAANYETPGAGNTFTFDNTPPSAPSNTVTSPNGGETWAAGSGQTIIWNSAGITDTRLRNNPITLEYSTDGGATFPSTIVANIANTESYAWTLPDIKSSTVRVRIIVTDSMNYTAMDTSDANFSIKPALTLTAPNGGETWTAGGSQNITWNSTGSTITTVKLAYSTDGGAAYPITISASEPNDSTYSWTIPAVTGNQIRVKISDASDSTIYDVSNGNFTINNRPVLGYSADNVIPTAQVVQATDGSGIITISFKLKDPDTDLCTLHAFQYSVDSGSIWNAPANSDASVSLGTGWTNNSAAYYSSAVDWAGITHSFTFNTKHVDVTGLSGVDQSDVMIRFTANDGIVSSADPGTSQAFAVDNASPAGLASFGVNIYTATSATLDWTAATDANFDHYEIWYGTNQTDVQNRAASEWDNADDANLVNAVTATTTITGLTSGTTYWFKIWAIDQYGNEMTITAISQSINTEPQLTGLSAAPNISANQTTDGTQNVLVDYEVFDAEQATVAVSIQYWNGSVWSAATTTSGDAGAGIDATSSTTDRQVIWGVGTDLAGSEVNNYNVRVIANDGEGSYNADTLDLGLDSLIIDTKSPINLSSLNVDNYSASTCTLSWTSATDANFDHYEIWYGTNQTDVQNRAADEWDNVDDASLASAITGTTTITGLSSGSTYYFKIWAIDQYGNEMTIAEVSQSLNLAPTDISLSNNTVNENEVSGTAVGTFTTTDPNGGDTHTYTLVTGAGSTDNDSFSIVGNTLQTAVMFDYETKASYSIRVRTTDNGSGNLYYEEEFAVNIVDVNEAPSAGDASVYVDEDAVNSTTVHTVVASDPDGDLLSFSITGGNTDAIFGINSSTGEITVSDNTNLDYETTAQYILTVEASDGSLFDNASITIDVNNVNETPVAAADNYAVDEDGSLNENAGTGVLSNDSDPDEDPLTATLVSDVTNGTLTLNSNGSFTYTPNANYNGSDGFTYYATDGSLSSSTETVSITVNAVNDAPVAVADAYSVSEDGSLNESVGTGVLSNDSDPESDPLNAVLLSDVSNGTLTLNSDGSFSYTPDPNYYGADNFTYQANDGLSNSNTANVSITVNAENDTPSDITISDTSVIDGSGPGTVVGVFASTDIDVGDTHAYSLETGTGSTDNASFTIDGDSLKLGITVDYEVKNSYSIRVRTTDNGTGNLWYEEIFTIAVDDSNDAPTDIVLSTSAVNENAAAGTVVGIISSTDPDTGDLHTYTFVAGAGDTNNANFSIAGDTLKTAAVFNYETKGSYTIRIRTTDNGTPPPLWFEKAITITVNNINEAPTDIALDNSTVNENVSAGTVVGNLSSVDPDAGNTHTYSLVAGTGSTDNASFTIAGAQLQTAAVFNYEAKNSYSIRVRSTDNGSLWYEKVFTVTVNNVNDAPADIILGNSIVSENMAIGAVVGTLTSMDPDTGNLHAYTFAAGSGDTNNTSFSLAGDTLKTAAVFDYETKSSYTIRIRTTDNGTPALWFEKVFAVTVTNINDAPVLSSGGGTLNYMENDTATIVDNSIAASDVDNANLASAQVSISANYTSPQDTLIFASQNGITGSFNAGTGVLSLIGSATLSNYQTALRSVKYRNSSDNPSVTSRTVSFVVNDGAVNSNTATRNVGVTPVNDAPAAVADGYAVSQNCTLTVAAPGILSNDIDPDNTTLTPTLITNVAQGSLTLNIDGSFRYIPNVNYSGADAFIYQISDGSLNSNAATVAVTVSDITPPQVVSLLPADNATGVGVNDSFIIAFNEKVFIGSGAVIIGRSSDLSVFETIAVTSGSVIGGGTSTITINPVNTFASKTGYYILIPATCFKDSSGNYFAGYTSDAQWNFTTKDVATEIPVLVMPVSNDTIDSVFNISFTLPEKALAGSVKMTFNRTGGSVDPYAPHIVTFIGSFESAGTHSTTLRGRDLSASAYVSSVSSNPSDSLVDDAVYTVTISYQDSLGNPAAQTSNTSVMYNSCDPVLELLSAAYIQGSNRLKLVFNAAVVSSQILTSNKLGLYMNNGSADSLALATPWAWSFGQTQDTVYVTVSQSQAFTVESWNMVDTMLAVYIAGNTFGSGVLVNLLIGYSTGYHVHYIKDVDPPLPVTGLTASALNCSTMVVNWTPSTSNDAKQVKLCASAVSMPAGQNAGEYFQTVGVAVSSAAITGLPKYGAVIYVAAFVADNAVNWSALSTGACGTVKLPDGVPPENTILVTLANVGDSGVAVALDIADTMQYKEAGVYFNLNFGSPSLDTSSSFTLGFHDTTFTSYGIIKPGTWYGVWAPFDSAGNIGVQKRDSVTIKNSAPLITAAPQYSLFEDSVWTITKCACDINNDPLQLNLINAPAGMTASNTTGSITWKPQNRDVGMHSFRLTASDGSLISDTATITLTVNNTNDPPVVLSVVIPDTVYEDSLMLGELRVSDPDKADSLAMTLGSTFSWLKVTVAKPDTADSVWRFELKGRPGNSDTGTIHLSILVADRAGATASSAADMYVVNTNDEPFTFIIKKEKLYGAAKYAVGGIDDFDTAFTYHSSFTCLSDTADTVRLLTNKTGIFTYYPLGDGKYLFTCYVEDKGGLIDSTPVVDTLDIKGVLTHAWSDSGIWNMVSAPVKSYKAAPFKAAGAILHWDESKAPDGVYKYYTRQGQINELSAGKSYWIRLDSAVTITLHKDSLCSDPLTMKLYKNEYGWNQISSPYTYPVKWNKDLTLWKWNPLIRDFEESEGVLYPWEGYWVLTDNADTATLSPEPYFITRAFSKRYKTCFADKTEWTFCIELTSNINRDADNLFGVSKHAKDGYDRLDRPEPPRMGSEPYLFFAHPEWKKSVNEFASDIRNTWNNKENIYQLGISPCTKEVTALNLNITGYGDDMPIYLFVNTGSAVVEYKQGVSIAVAPSDKEQYRTVFASGDRDFLNRFPVKFVMNDPYPNPCRPAATLRYTLPYRWENNGWLNTEPYKVKLVIYDARGREVCELVNRKQEPGHYKVLWRGKGDTGRLVASGFYFARLTAGKYSSVKKIIAIR